MKELLRDLKILDDQIVSLSNIVKIIMGNAESDVYDEKKENKILANFQMEFDSDEQIIDFMEDPNAYDLKLLKIKPFEI